jgi:hypothetical protein
MHICRAHQSKGREAGLAVLDDAERLQNKVRLVCPSDSGLERWPSAPYLFDHPRRTTGPHILVLRYLRGGIADGLTNQSKDLQNFKVRESEFLAETVPAKNIDSSS